jgi:signal transduction histidine kinase
LSSLGPAFVALVILVVVGAAASSAVDQASRRADKGRLADRRELARAYAAPVRSWVDAATAEAGDLAQRLAPARTPSAAAPVIDAFLAAAPPFAREVVLVDANMRVVAASAGPALFTNRQLQRCASGGPAARTQVTEVARAPDPTKVTAVSVPWDCGRLRVAAAASTGGNTVVVLAPLDEGSARVPPLAVHSLRVSLVEPDDRTNAAAKDDANRGSRGEGPRDDGIIAAYAGAGPQWGVLIEQDAADFDSTAAADQPLVLRLFSAAVLVVAVGAVFVALAIFDARRRKAHARAEEAKQAFFATVGHELRTPLTILKGYSDTLTARWDSLSDDAKEMLVSNMAPAAQRLAGLVEKLILASNIQAEAYIKPVASPTGVPDVLQQVAARWRPLAPLHTFAVDVDPLLPEALADADALEQVLQQLVDNAVKYSPSGGRVTLSAMRAKRGMEVSVSDEGVGLPQNASEIFEPLVQGEAVDTRVHDEGGAGVGLYIVRTLVRDMGGAVRAEAQKPAGSRFVVTLRAAKTKAAARPVTRV